MLFAVGSLLQFLYGLHFGGLKQVKDIILVIDNSESMLETDPDNERYSAAKQLIQNMESDKRVAVVVFNDSAKLVQPFVSVGEQAGKDSVNTVIDGLNEAIGGTDFALALGEALNTIESEASERGTMVILLSDGFSESRIDELLATYKEKQITVNTIGLSQVLPKGSELLKQIARSTGGSYRDVTKADGLAMAFQNIYDTIDNRTLLTERTGPVADNVFYQLLRIVSIAILGVALGVALGIVFDNRYLALSFGIGGLVGGLLAGFILESGLSGQSFGDGVSRLTADLVLALVIGLFPLIVPIRENNSARPMRGGRNRGLNGQASTGLSGRAKDSRSHGF
nr:VWA domain-containing protein [Paenibacillus castaneae]